MPTPHDHITWTAPTAAPDVRMFHVGTFDRSGNTWTAAMRWDTLGEKLMVDWACVLPVIMANWSAVAIWLRTPDGLGGFIEQAATGKFTADDFETDPVSGLKYRYDCISIEPTAIPNPPEAWEFIAVSYDRNGNANMTGGVVTGPTATLNTLPATSGIDFTPPANVTDVVAADPEWTDPGPDGVRLIRQKITYSIADAITLGVHVFAEAPDQSYTDPFVLGVTTVGGSEGVSGEWSPIDVGRFPYEPGKPLVMELPQPPTATESRRFYLVSYRDRIENTLVRHGEANATPSVVVTHTQYAGATGEEFSRNVTGMVLIETGTVNSDGKLKRYIEVGAVAPDDLNFAGVTADLVDSTGKLIAANDFGGTEFTAAGGIRVLWDEPASVTTWSLRLRAYSGSGTNNYAVGVTPEISVSVGTTGGTVDLAAALSTSIAAHLEVASGVFGVKASGITESLIANAAVSTTKIVNEAVGSNQIAPFAVTAAKIGSAAIQNAHIDRLTANKVAIIDADIVNLSAAKITAGSLAASVIYTGTLNANQVNAGDFTGCTLTLTNNSVITEIKNQFSVNIGQFVGMNIRSSSVRTDLYPMGIVVEQVSGNYNFVRLDAVYGYGELYLYNPGTATNATLTTGAGASLSLNGGGGSAGSIALMARSPYSFLAIGGSQVVRNPKALISSDVAGIIDLLRYHGLCF